MRTAIIIAAGLLLLALCLLIGRFAGSPVASAMARAALYFLPVWFIAAAVNMWMGVAKAGYSVAEEAPIFALIFAVPAAVALFVWWHYSRG
jgi:hypothetical protein